MSAHRETAQEGAGQPDPEAISPCIAVCRLDEAGRYCVGCYRTLEEIARWTSYDRARRQQVWQLVRMRRTQWPQAL